MNKEIHIFLSSTFDAILNQSRDLFRNELLTKMNIIAGDYGYNVFVQDFEMGIPKDTPMQEVLDVCLKTIEKSDVFLCILGDNYGSTISSNDYLNFDKNWEYYGFSESSYNNQFSVLEMEIRHAIAQKKKCVCLKKKDLLPTDDRYITLVKRINTYNQSIIGEYSDKNDIISFVESLLKDFNFSNEESNIENRYYSNAIRYYVENSFIDNLNSYVDDENQKIMFIYGAKGSGKTTELINFTNEYAYRHQTAKVVLKSVMSNPRTVSLVLESILKSQSYDISHCLSQEDVFVEFQNYLYSLSTTEHKSVIIIDGIDLMPEFTTAVELFYFRLPKNVKLIISSNRKSDLRYAKKNDNIIIQYHTSIKRSDLFRAIMLKESKELEYKIIESSITEITESFSLKAIRLLTSLFIKKAKFNNAQETLKNLLSLHSEREIGSQMLNYVKARNKSVEELLYLIACTSRGLTLEDLLNIANEETKEALYWVYFDLETNENAFLVPDYFDTFLELASDYDNNDRYMKTLISYFGSERTSDEDNSFIESFSLYMFFSYIDKAKEMIEELYHLHIILCDKYENENLYMLFDKLSRDQLDSLAIKWMQQYKKFTHHQNILFSLANLLENFDYYDYAIIINKYLYAIAIKENNITNIASLSLDIASLYYKIDNPKALHYALKCLKIIQENKQIIAVRKLSDLYADIGEILGTYSSYSDRYKKTSIKCLEISNRIITENYSEIHPLLVYSYYNCASAFYDMGDYSKAWSYVKKAANIVKENYNDVVRDNDYYSINEFAILEANILSSSHRAGSSCNFQEVIESINETIIQYDGENRNKRDVANALHARANVYILMEGYEQQAIDDIKKSFKIEKTLNAGNVSYLSYYSVAYIYAVAFINTGNKRFYQNAFSYLARAFQTALRDYKKEDAIFIDFYLLEAKIFAVNNELVNCISMLEKLRKSLDINKVEKELFLIDIKEEIAIPLKSQLLYAYLGILWKI
jgi:tetratricopeptide (TPR) repeat protein